MHGKSDDNLPPMQENRVSATSFTCVRIFCADFIPCHINDMMTMGFIFVWICTIKNCTKSAGKIHAQCDWIKAFLSICSACRHGKTQDTTGLMRLALLSVYPKCCKKKSHVLWFLWISNSLFPPEQFYNMAPKVSGMVAYLCQHTDLQLCNRYNPYKLEKYEDIGLANYSTSSKMEANSNHLWVRPQI